MSCVFLHAADPDHLNQFHSISVVILSEAFSFLRGPDTLVSTLFFSVIVRVQVSVPHETVLQQHHILLSNELSSMSMLDHHS